MIIRTARKLLSDTVQTLSLVLFPIHACFLTQLNAAEPQVIRGPSTNLDPFVLSSLPDSATVSIISANEGEPLFDGYRMVGEPDGLGAFDNGDDTFTVLMNHYATWVPAGLGGFDIDTPYPARAHGGKGSFVSKWVINMPNHPDAPWEVQSGEDLITSVQLWDKEASAYVTADKENLLTLGSSTLALTPAFFNLATGKGTKTRIYTTGEELPPFNFGPQADRSDGGRAFAVAVDGADEGTAFELPLFGNMLFENLVPNPHPQDLTVVLVQDDEDLDGRVYLYVGTKTTEGNDITRAGLTNGTLYGLVVEGKSQFPGDTFDGGEAVSFVALDDLTNVDHNERVAISIDAGLTLFADMEDGDWDPNNPKQFYFTTNGSREGDAVPTRLWRVTLTDITNPTLGGVIDVVVDGTDPDLRSFDNIGIDYESNVLIQEDEDTFSERLGKIWRYLTAFETIEEIAAHNPLYFDPESEAFLSQDDETSGIIDASDILGNGWYLLTSRAHVPGGADFFAMLTNFISDPPIYAPGQLLAMFLPPTNANASGEDVVIYPLSDRQNVNLNITLEGAQGEQKASLSWNGVGALEVSDDLSGQWQTVTRESPYVSEIESDSKFYRVAAQLDRPAGVYIPASYNPDETMPLIVSLHGFTDTPSGMESVIPLRPIADTAGFIYVVPEGPAGSDGLSFWNSIRECCDTTGSNRDDVGFLRGLIASISKDFNIDPKRIYLVGHSNGGMMSYRMACEHSDLIAAMVSLAGSTFTNPADCVPSEPVSILHIHGTSDSIVPYDGTPSPLGPKLVSATGNLETWRTYNGCGELVSDSDTTLDLDLNIQGMESSVTHADGCPEGIAVELWTIEGGSHSPRATRGEESSELAARIVDWLFSHPKP